MWDLQTMKKKNDEWVERMRKNWRGAVLIQSESDIESIHAFPYYDPTVERKVFFASNLGELLPVPENYLQKQLKVIFDNNGSYHLSLYSSNRDEVRLVIWFG